MVYSKALPIRGDIRETYKDAKSNLGWKLISKERTPLRKGVVRSEELEFLYEGR